MYWTVAACSAEATEMSTSPVIEGWGNGTTSAYRRAGFGETPSTSLLVLTRRLSKRLSQALSWSEKVGEWRTVAINGNRKGFELRGEKYCKNNWWCYGFFLIFSFICMKLFLVIRVLLHIFRFAFLYLVACKRRLLVVTVSKRCLFFSWSMVNQTTQLLRVCILSLVES